MASRLPAVGLGIGPGPIRGDETSFACRFDGRSDEPPVIRADHPSLFLIRDDRTGSIMFLGGIVRVVAWVNCFGDPRQTHHMGATTGRDGTARAWDAGTTLGPVRPGRLSVDGVTRDA